MLGKRGLDSRRAQLQHLLEVLVAVRRPAVHKEHPKAVLERGGNTRVGLHTHNQQPTKIHQAQVAASGAEAVVSHLSVKQRHTPAHRTTPV
jgi:hypothetical protein